MPPNRKICMFTTGRFQNFGAALFVKQKQPKCAIGMANGPADTKESCTAVSLSCRWALYPPGAILNVRFGCHNWGVLLTIVSRGQGCCLLSCNARDGPSTENDAACMSTVLRQPAVQQWMCLQGLAACEETCRQNVNEKPTQKHDSTYITFKNGN